MKISAKKYAQALYDVLVEAKNEAEVKIFIKNFILLLQQENIFLKIDDILLHFSAIYNKDKNVNDGELILAKTLDDKTIASVKNTIKNFLQVDAIDLQTKIDPKLIGGFKAVFSDYIIDASVHTCLKQLKKSLIS